MAHRLCPRYSPGTSPAATSWRPVRASICKRRIPAQSRHHQLLYGASNFISSSSIFFSPSSILIKYTAPSALVGPSLLYSVAPRPPRLTSLETSFSATSDDGTSFSFFCTAPCANGTDSSATQHGRATDTVSGVRTATASICILVPNHSVVSGDETLFSSLIAARGQRATTFASRYTKHLLIWDNFSTPGSSRAPTSLFQTAFAAASIRYHLRGVAPEFEAREQGCHATDARGGRTRTHGAVMGHPGRLGAPATGGDSSLLPENASNFMRG